MEYAPDHFWNVHGNFLSTAEWIEMVMRAWDEDPYIHTYSHTNEGLRIPFQQLQAKLENAFRHAHIQSRQAESGKTEDKIIKVMPKGCRPKGSPVDFRTLEKSRQNAMPLNESACRIRMATKMPWATYRIQGT